MKAKPRSGILQTPRTCYLLPCLALLLLFHRSDHPVLLGRYSPIYAAITITAFILSVVAVYILGNDERRIRCASRIRRLPLLAIFVSVASIVLVSSFFLPDFVLSLKHCANWFLLGVLLITTFVLILSAAVDAKSLLNKVALSLFTTLLCLMTLEIVLRILPRRGFQDIPSEKDTTSLTDINQEVTWGHALRLSSNFERIYEFIPESRFTFLGAPVRINSQGFRDREYHAKKPDQVVRVVGIGDSVMFGWGVEEAESFLGVAEARLNSAQTSHKYEIINCAAPGYNTTMEVATLEDKGLGFQPDLVVVSYVANDIDLPNFLRAEPGMSDLSHSYLASLLFDRQLPNDALIGAPYREHQPTETSRKFENDPAKVPPQYRHMVGRDGVRAALKRLSALSKAKGI